MALMCARPTNYTIDDSFWGTSSLSLTPGWNMLRINGSDEYINETQRAEMDPLLPSFWNGSISWTTTVHSNTTINFVGTDIWLYGMSGPNGTQFSVTLDDILIGQYSSFALVADYAHIMYAAHGLDDVSHTVCLSNLRDTSMLAFDVAIVQSIISFNGSNSVSSTALAATSSTTVATPESSALSIETTSVEAAGESAAIYGTWSPQQLALLAIPYEFHWNSAVYFVVVFVAFIVTTFGVMCAVLITRTFHSRSRRTGMAASLAECESYPIDRLEQTSITK